MTKALILAVGLLMLTGCEEMFTQNVNRIELVNEATKELMDAIRPVKDEATARAQLPAIQQAADKARALWEEIHAAEVASGGSGMAKITQNADRKSNKQLMYSLNAMMERLRTKDPKAYEIVSEAIEGVDTASSDTGLF